MRERRFELYEIPKNHTSGPNTVTESELKRRTEAIVQRLLGNNRFAFPDWSWENIYLPILCHGEGEKGEARREWTPRQLANHLREHPECTVSLDRGHQTEQNEPNKMSKCNKNNELTVANGEGELLGKANHPDNAMPPYDPNE